jgi:acetoin utilization protein AcuB
MKMRDVMRPARWVVSKDARLRTAEHLMARHRVRQLPVVDGGKLVGLLSERDLLAYRAYDGQRAEWWRAPVVAAMQAAPETASPDDDVDLDRLASDGIEALPIVEDEYLVGIVRPTDVLDAEIETSAPPVRRADMTAADAMTEHPWTCRPGDSLLDAAKLMVDYEVRHLPVVEDGELVGILSDRDIRTVVGDPAQFVETGDDELSVHDAMTPNPVTVPAGRRLREIASELIEDDIGALPVVDAAGKLVGIISYVDALRALAA